MRLAPESLRYRTTTVLDSSDISPVLLVSKENLIFFGYFDPENISLDYDIL